MSNDIKQHKNLVDITGQRFGRLRVKDLLYRKQSRQTVWLCVCDCGNEVNVPKPMLTSGNTQSCGCLKKEVDSRRFRKATGQAARHYVVRYYQQNAKKAGRDFTLTDEELSVLFSSRCHYCGTKPQRVTNVLNVNGQFVYSGIDRLDPAGGYTPDNVVSCCTACNIAKQAFTLDQFKSWICRVHEHMAL